MRKKEKSLKEIWEKEQREIIEIISKQDYLKPDEVMTTLLFNGLRQISLTLAMMYDEMKKKENKNVPDDISQHMNPPEATE